MDFRILGPVEARLDGRTLELGGSRQRALLALLLLARGAPVSRDRLVEELWAGDTKGVKALHVAVSRLRRALVEQTRLATTPDGYRLLLEPGELDLDRFAALCDEGRRALAAGEPVRASVRLRAAMQEWRGPPLAGVAFEPFAQAEALTLEAQQAAALEDRIEADLMCGRHAELVAELEALVARSPLRERLRGQLMRALYRAGRQGDALAVYRQTVQALDAELGLRPSPELEQLERAILVHDPKLSRDSASAEAPAVTRQRATATILFTDIVGSTTMRATLGDEQAEAIRREHDRRIRHAIAAHGGREVKTLGDGFLATFQAAGAAIGCAVEVQRAIARQARRGRIDLAVRVGIGAGDVESEDADVFGTPVVEAQRLCAAAASGEILAADVVRLLAGSSARSSLEDAGERALRGLPEPLRAWRIRWHASDTVSIPLAPALALDGAPVLAGRALELAELHAAWRDVTAGHRRGVFVSGEPGIGKTRLAAELAAHALRDGGLVLYGRCDDGPAAAAQPFADALGAYAAACPPDELHVQLDQAASDLLPLLPALSTRLPGVSERPPAAPELQRLRLLDAVTTLLQSAGEPVPVLLVLDDLHWADELALLLTRHVLRADVAMRVLVLATYRDSEPSRSPLLAHVVTGLARERQVARIELGPLEADDIAGVLAGAGRPRSLAGRVHAITDGNPFFVEEVVSALADHAEPETALTPRARDVVRARLARLPGRAVEVLTAAAVAGAEFDADVVAVAAGLETTPALEALEAAERARLVRPGGSLDRYRFAHALVRQAVLEDLPASRRARLHARIAMALERGAGAAADLALHLDAAGSVADAGAALRYARQAGDEAAAHLAFDGAAEHYARALRAHRRLANAPAEQGQALELAYGRALRLAGDPRAADVLRRVVAEAEHARDGERMSEALLTFVLGFEADLLHEDSEMVGQLRNALALLPQRDSAVRARLQALLAQQALYSIPHPERRAMIDRALAMARRVADPMALAAVLSSHLWTDAHPGRREQRLQLVEELLSVALQTSPAAACEAYVVRFLALVESGDLDGADTALAHARTCARLPISQWMVTQWESARALLAGRLTEAETLALQGAHAGREAGFRPEVVEPTLAALIWHIRYAQGRLAEIEPLTAPRNPTRPVSQSLADAQMALARDDPDSARDALTDAHSAGLLATPQGPAWAVTMLAAADATADLDQPALAAPLYDLLAPHANVMLVQSGPIGRAVGRLALTLGRRDEAERHLRSAIELCERMHAPAFAAITRYDLGRVLLPSPQGAALLDHAHAAAETLGMPGWAERAQAASTSVPGVRLATDLR